jgi:hypothetical protein
MAALLSIEQQHVALLVGMALVELLTDFSHFTVECGSPQGGRCILHKRIDRAIVSSSWIGDDLQSVVGEKLAKTDVGLSKRLMLLHAIAGRNLRDLSG